MPFVFTINACNQKRVNNKVLSIEIALFSVSHIELFVIQIYLHIPQRAFIFYVLVMFIICYKQTKYLYLLEDIKSKLGTSCVNTNVSISISLI